MHVRLSAARLARAKSEEHPIQDGVLHRCRVSQHVRSDAAESFGNSRHVSSAALHGCRRTHLKEPQRKFNIYLALLGAHAARPASVHLLRDRTPHHVGGIQRHRMICWEACCRFKCMAAWWGRCRCCMRRAPAKLFFDCWACQISCMHA